MLSIIKGFFNRFNSTHAKKIRELETAIVSLPGVEYTEQLGNHCYIKLKHIPDILSPKIKSINYPSPDLGAYIGHDISAFDQFFDDREIITFDAVLKCIQNSEWCKKVGFYYKSRTANSADLTVAFMFKEKIVLLITPVMIR